MAQGIEQRVAGFIRRYGLVPGGSRVLVGVSGGADSMALLAALHCLCQAALLDAQLVCGHVNHQLRGAEGDLDEAFVRRSAETMELPFVRRSIHVRQLADAQGLSLETAARQLRLEALVQMARGHGCNLIALGHQADDNAETVIHRLLRGTGLRGLAGIWPARSCQGGHTIIRPLLCLRRAEILQYLQAISLAWRQDSTNTDCRFTRNAIRHRLIPYLERACGADLVGPLGRLALATHRLYSLHVLPEADRLERQVLAGAWGGTVVDWGRLVGRHPMVQVELLRRALIHAGCRERDLTSVHYRAILDMTAGGGPRRTCLPAGLTAQFHRGRIWVGIPRSCCAGACMDLQIPGTSRFDGILVEARLVEPSQVRPGRTAAGGVEHLDWDAIRPPLTVRQPRPGDRFRPLGMGCDKKVARFLLDSRVPPWVRREALVFEDRVRIVWVYPVRISDQVKVTSATRKVLILEVRQA